MDTQHTVTAKFDPKSDRYRVTITVGRRSRDFLPMADTASAARIEAGWMAKSWIESATRQQQDVRI